MTLYIFLSITFSFCFSILFYSYGHPRVLHSFPTRRSSDLLFHVLVGCGLLMLKVSRLKLPVIWLLVSMWLNTLTKSQIWTLKKQIGRAVQQECRDRSRMPSSA